MLFMKLEYKLLLLFIICGYKKVSLLLLFIFKTRVYLDVAQTDSRNEIVTVLSDTCSMKQINCTHFSL